MFWVIIRIMEIQNLTHIHYKIYIIIIMFNGFVEHILLFSTIVYIYITYMLNRHIDFFDNLYKTNINYQKILCTFSFLHNLTMMLFSCSIVYKLNCLLIDDVSDVHVTLENLLNSPMLWELDICWLFAYSKIYEFMDILLVYLEGKRPIYLQKYHQIVAVYVWFFACYYKSPCIMFATYYNAIVHSIMYFYYMLNVIIKLPNYVRPLMSLLQLIQLLYGLYYTIIYYTIKHIEYIYSPVVLSTILFIGYVFALIVLSII